MEGWGVGGFCIFTGGRIYVRMYIHTYVPIVVHTHTHIHTYMYVHVVAKPICDSLQYIPALYMQHCRPALQPF